MRFVVAFPVLVFALLWGGQAQAEEFYWVVTRNGSSNGSSPVEACAARAAVLGFRYSGQITKISYEKFSCTAQYLNASVWLDTTLYAYRHGDSCPPDTVYNASTGSCDADCLATQGTTEFHMFLATTRSSTDDPFPDPSTYEVTVPAAVCSQSCRFTNQSPGTSVTCGALTGSDGLGLYCYHPFVGSGEQCQSGDTPQQGPQDFGGPTPVDPADPDDPTDPAVTCRMTPGYVWTGTTCAPVFEPEDNGGDDGGDTGNGDTGGDTGGGDPGSGDPGGGDTGGGDTGGDTGGGGTGGDGSDDTPYDPAAEWNDAEAGSLGSATGSSIAESLTGGVTGALEEREAEITEALDQVPDTVGDWFGDLPGLSFMDNLFVPAAGCSVTTIPLELNGYDFSITIDFCVLSKYRTLLEWVIWCLTAIAVWNVYYSGLRLQNAAASRGGF